MSNRTAKEAVNIHGTNPQFLVEKILRNRIYASPFWKEHCFALTAETLVDKAMQLKSYGGTYGGNKKPTPFICLILKMLQIQPEKEILIEFIRNKDYKYVRVLGAFYLRLVGKATEIYEYLEPLYNDFRKIRRRVENGYQIVYIDEFIEELLISDYSCDIALPFLQRRTTLEDQGLIPPRISVLEDDLDASDHEGDKEQDIEKGEEISTSNIDLKSSKRKRDSSPSPSRRSRSPSGGSRHSRSRSPRSRSGSRERQH